MMSPTVILRDGELEAGLGSGGSNRIRSAILQTIVRLVADGCELEAAVNAPRVHFESGEVQAEPGIDEAALDAARAARRTVVRWPDQTSSSAASTPSLAIRPRATRRRRRPAAGRGGGGRLSAVPWVRPGGIALHGMS